MGGLLVVTDEHPLLPHPARGAIVWVVPNQTVIPGPDGVDIAKLQELNTEIHALEERWLNISAQSKKASGAEEVFFLAQGYRQP